MDLRANAIITAVDRFSGPVARMAGALNGLTGRAAGMVNGARRAGKALSNMATAAAVPASLLGGLAMRGEYDIDRLSRQMESVGEISAAQRKMLVDNAFQTSVAVGEGADDIIKAQRELIQGGLDPQTVAATSKLIAMAAKSNAMGMSEVAEDAINVARGLGMAFGTTEEKTAALTKALEFMSVVPALSTENWEGLRNSLKYAAPVFGALNRPITELGAALSILADAGFKGEEGGTALRTMMLRMIAPTKQATQAMRAAGVQMQGLYSFDNGRVQDMESLKARLSSAGFDVTEEVSKSLARFSDVSKFDGLEDFGDQMQTSLMEALSIDKGDAQSRGVLKEAINQHIFAGVKDLDLTRAFTELQKMPVQAFSKLFGIQRASQALALKKYLARMPELAQQFDQMMPGAVGRRFDIMDQGMAQGIDKLMSSIKMFRHALFDSGFSDQLAGWFNNMAQSFQGFAKINPDALKGMADGAMFAAIAGGITMIANSPVARAAAAIGLLATAMGSAKTSEKGMVGNLQDWWAETGGFKGRADMFLDQIEGAPDHARRMLFGDGIPASDRDELGRMLKMQTPAQEVNPRLQFAPPEMVRDIVPAAGPQSIDVTGKVDANVTGTVQGTVNGTVDVQVRVEGPGQVIQQNGGAVSGSVAGSLNTGKSMPDSGGGQ